jgi:CheY-like chemotaxis protein
MDPYDPEVPTIAAELLKIVERGTDISRGLLAFSRKQAMEPVRLELQESLRGFEKMLHRLVGDSIEINFVTHCSRLPLVADKTQIEQVIMNLCTNSRDAMPNGGTIEIDTRSQSLTSDEARRLNLPSGGDYALLTVSDTGIGMDDDVKERIFEPFFTTKKEGEGTGLGVPIVYGIVKAHGGSIHVHSEIGKGTSFQIYLPITQQEMPTQRHSVKQEDLRGNETLLVVEDEQSVRDIIRMHLQKRGYEVLEASNGNDALRIFAENQNRIQLLLIDVVMPGISGQELCDQVRQRKPDAKVLFMSGFPAQYLRGRYLVSSDAEVIGKPIAAPLLIKKVREVLDKA